MNIMTHLYLNKDNEDWIRSFDVKPNTAIKKIRELLEKAQGLNKSTEPEVEKIKKRLDKIENFLSANGNF
jgi:hypothetical protein